MIFPKPCLDRKSDEDDWRKKSGYDATDIFTKVLIENNDNINREKMLESLEKKRKAVDNSMQWEEEEERSVIARNYCPVKVTDSDFKLIP